MGAGTVGVLAVQGAFAEHEQVLDRLGVPWVELRGPADLSRGFERLVLPGGESTVQGKLLREQGMLGPLRERILGGMPVLATCAGLILLAERIEDEGAVGREAIRPERHLATFPVTVRRNAYGRQLGSFRAEAPLLGQDGRPVGKPVPLTFVRAPGIAQVGPGVQTLVSLDRRPVAVRQGSQVACAFHPELDDDPRIHELFLSL